MLDIDWSKVPEGYDWAAQDDDGCVFAYAGEPSMFLTSIMGGWEHDGPSVFVKTSGKGTHAGERQGKILDRL